LKKWFGQQRAEYAAVLATQDEITQGKRKIKNKEELQFFNRINSDSKIQLYIQQMYMRYSDIATELIAKGKIDPKRWYDESNIEWGRDRARMDLMTYHDYKNVESDRKLKDFSHRISLRVHSIIPNNKVLNSVMKVFKRSERMALHKNPYHPGIWIRPIN
jgi:hypothetical protein